MGCACDIKRPFFKAGWLPLYSKNCGFEGRLKFGNWASGHNDITVTCVGLCWVLHSYVVIIIILT